MCTQIPDIPDSCAGLILETLAGAGQEQEFLAGFFAVLQLFCDFDLCMEPNQSNWEHL